MHNGTACTSSARPLNQHCHISPPPKSDNVLGKLVYTIGPSSHEIIGPTPSPLPGGEADMDFPPPFPNSGLLPPLPISKGHILTFNMQSDISLNTTQNHKQAHYVCMVSKDNQTLGSVGKQFCLLIHFWQRLCKKYNSQTFSCTWRTYKNIKTFTL